jgi:O-antigen/teichoic acid export membrane protein
MSQTQTTEGYSPPSEPTLETGQKAAQTLLRNSTFYLGADFLVKVLSFIFNIYVVRELGDARFGAYNTALAYAGIFSILGDLGMTQYAIREIARGRRRADDLFWNLVMIRLLLAFVATLFIVASAYFVAGYPTTMVLGIFLVCVGFFFHAFFGPVVIVMAGKERIDFIAVLDIVIQLFFVGVGTWVLVSGYSFHSLIIASYLGVPVAALIGLVYIKRTKLAALPFNIEPSTWFALLKYGLPFAMITFTLLAAKDFDTVLLSLWRSPEEVGWYRAAYNLTYKLLFIRGALLSTLTPQMSRYYGVSKDRVGKTFNFSFKLLWAFSFPLAVGTTLLAYPLTTWLYTEEYANSALVLAILIWALPFLNLSSLYGSVATASDKEKGAMKVYVTAALINLAINLIVIPIWGYLGATISTVVTEAITLLFFYLLMRHEFPLTDLKNSLLKPFIAGLAMAGVVLLSYQLFFPITIVLGAVTYGFILLALRPFNQTEAQIFQGLWLSFRRRIGWSTSS